MNVTGALMGSGVSLRCATPAGNATHGVFLNEAAKGDYGSTTGPLLTKAGTGIILYQTSPMTAGAATAYTEIWSS